MNLLAVFAVIVLLYVYVGYPTLLTAVVRLRGIRPVRHAPVTPSVSFVISAFNEASVILQKLHNALALEYPAGQLEIVVVSDASTDGTDEIVLEFRDRGVRLVRQPTRRGKTAGLNLAVPTLRGEIIVFSDANALYEPDAVRQLVRNFADPEVGCVTGEARYTSEGHSVADEGERAYWEYEIRLKRFESALGSMVGGDGAIYAIRRELWEPLPNAAINDFLNPLQIVARGWRAVYEPTAVCYEEPAGEFTREWKRRTRIVSRSWRAILMVPSVLNPARVGLFSLFLISHKVVRWLSAPLLTVVGVAGVVGVWPFFSGSPTRVATAVGLVGAALLIPSVRRLAGFGAYFLAINLASFVGVLKGSVGSAPATWSTPREAPSAWAEVRAIWVLTLVVTAILALAPLTLTAVGFGADRRRVWLWLCTALLGYVYVGYPLALVAVNRFRSAPHRRAAIEPTVCLVIPAHNEVAVIGPKLTNTFELDYPPDRLEVVVASDGSTDGTDDVVRGFMHRAVRLVSFEQRRGKAAALAAALPDVRAEIVVFTDANTFLSRDALRALVRNFADEAVGAVSGDVILLGDRAWLGPSEDAYYRWERWLQRYESQIDSIVGADGALYAVRRELVVAPAEDTILDDMAIPMAVLRLGSRVVFEPEAVAVEQGPASAREEFERKARIAAGAVQFATRRASAVPLGRPQVLAALVSHKLLRWCSPVLLLGLVATSLSLADEGLIYAVVAAILVGAGLMGAVGCIPRFRRFPAVGLLHYTCLVNAALAVGLIRGVLGRQQPTWRRFPSTPVRALAVGRR